MKKPMLYLGICILFIGCTDESNYHRNISEAELDCEKMGLHGISTHKHYNGFWQNERRTKTYCIEKAFPKKGELN